MWTVDIIIQDLVVAFFWGHDMPRFAHQPTFLRNEVAPCIKIIIMIYYGVWLSHYVIAEIQ